MKPIKHSVAIVIKNSQGRFLVVQRPKDENSPLAGVWGFPAITLRDGESEQDAAQRASQTKLGVNIQVGNKIGERTADRGDYILHLSDYAATIPDGGVPKVPQPDTSMTQYINFKYTDDPKVLFPAAQNGSLCSQVYLSSLDIEWSKSGKMEETKNDLPIKLFVTTEEWRQWLEAHNGTDGVWLRFYKKGHGESINHDGALNEALCFGWIDSQAAKYDDDSFLQKFTPRRKKSIWSKRNIELVDQLVKSGRMTSRGLAEAEAAKADGRWQQAYDSPANMQIPKDFLEELAKSPKAQTFFETLNKTNLYAIAWRLQTAKTDTTRRKRMQTIIAMLADNKKFH